MKLKAYQDVCEFFSVTRDGLRKIQLKNLDFPKPIKLGDTKQSPVYFDMDEIEQWVQKLKNKRDGLSQAAFDAKRPLIWLSAPLWANWWCVNSFGTAFWFENKPDRVDVVDGVSVAFDSSSGYMAEAPCFGYVGDWLESIIENPYPINERLGFEVVAMKTNIKG